MFSLFLSIFAGTYAQQNNTGNVPVVPGVVETAGEIILMPQVALKGMTDQVTISTGIGLHVYNTASTTGATAVAPGYYSWDGNRWVSLNYPARKTPNVSNSSHSAASNFSTTTDQVDLVLKQNGDLLGNRTRNDRSTPSNYKNTGFNNTAIGLNALANNDEGCQNTAIGSSTLISNVNGSQNTGVGQGALLQNVSGSNNTAIGLNALFNNTTGANNTVMGHAALVSNSGGGNNTALGAAALQNATGSNNTAIGQKADMNKTAGNNCIAIGYNATTGNNADCVQIGNENIVSIGAQVSWSTRSDKRIKKNIKENVPGLDFIVRLKPISYSYDLTASDKITGAPPGTLKADVASREKAEAMIHTGFAAQDVEEILKSLAYTFDGLVKPQSSKDLYSLSYGLFTVPLVKAVQEQQEEITKQQITVVTLQKQIELQQQQINELRSLLKSFVKK